MRHSSHLNVSHTHTSTTIPTAMDHTSRFAADSPVILSDPELAHHINGILASTSRTVHTLIDLCVRVTLLVLFLGHLVVSVGIEGSRGTTFDTHSVWPHS